ncbi:MAG: YqgE/AlgH family protein [Rhodospirillaceae bacterium]|nr:YqgE/AlgH family protein [Rhodospirillaceae bacterium]|tara:strand:+ start:2573 stop:3157 length:585 start_codon:yes stop_codon:yes gene_type:complete
MTDKPESEDNSTYLTGNLLIAMPQMQDDRFMRSVVYVCAHTSDGAMGLVINKIVESVSFPELLDQLNISADNANREIRVHFGGPVETGRGFVLHSADYVQDATLVIDDEVALTATVDILKSIADGEGPDRSILALGYAGWAPGQLDQEIQANGWLSVPADNELVFGTTPDSKWERAMGKIGIDFNMLSGDAGHA